MYTHPRAHTHTHTHICVCVCVFVYTEIEREGFWWSLCVCVCVHVCVSVCVASVSRCAWHKIKIFHNFQLQQQQQISTSVCDVCQRDGAFLLRRCDGRHTIQMSTKTSPTFRHRNDERFESRNQRHKNFLPSFKVGLHYGDYRSKLVLFESRKNV